MDFNALSSLLDHQSTVIYRVMWRGVDGGDNSYVIIKMFARWVGECLLKMNVDVYNGCSRSFIAHKIWLITC